MIRHGRQPATAAGAALILVFAPLAAAQWDPAAGDWGKSDASDLRIVSWNIEDGICRTADKSNGFNSWSALARSVALLKPDVLILQETGDNVGNGTGSGVDSVVNLLTTIDLFIRGGTDTFTAGNPPVGAYVQLWAPGYDLPYRFVSLLDDGFNRNVVLSRHPFADLNGDGVATRSDTPFISADLYAPGGSGGIRGFQFAEINLPDATYAGNLVMGNAHLRCCGESSDFAERLAAGKNIAYFVDYFYNGAGGTTPDPRNKIFDSPPATSVLNPYTPVILGGDWNEDEQNNGRKGPAEWMTRAEFTGGTDGTDRDRGDALYDDARNPLNNNRATHGSSSKLDYVAWQDTIATPRRQAILNSASMSGAAIPEEFQGFGLCPTCVTGSAADHRAVLMDMILPLTADCPFPENGTGDTNGNGIPDACEGCTTAGQCDDASACTSDSCVGSVCVHSPITCTDGNACTSDACNAGSGCVFTTITCNDGNACTTDSCNTGSGCVFTPITCNDGSSCTADSCNTGSGCVFTPLSCNDGNGCTADSCQEGTGCVHAPLSCSDSNACTTDICHPAIGCYHEPVDCEDGDLCTQDTCSATLGCRSTPANCDDGDACTLDECYPDPDDGGCFSSPITCDDGDLCTTDSCDTGAGCVFTPMVCDDGDPCTADTCQPTGACAFTPVGCAGACCHADGSCAVVLVDSCTGFVCDVNTLLSCGGNPGGCCMGDTDGNGVVNPGDRGGVSANIGQTSDELLCLYDLDGNGTINAGDRGFVSANIGLCSELPPYMNGSGPDPRFTQPTFAGSGTTCTNCP